MDEERKVRTACPLNCTDACVLVVTVRNGVATDIAVDPQHEMFGGITCPKARYQLDRVYGSKRLLHPTRRAGSGWQRISWDDAADIMAEKFLEAVNRYGSESIYIYYEWGSRGVLKTLEQRFFNALGGVTLPSGSLCWGAGTAAQEYDFGAYVAHDPVDMMNTRLAVIWGRNPAASNVHTLPFLREAKARGATVVVIDPVPTPTVSLADIWVSPRPGTDGALALGMAHEIIRCGLIDEQFIRSRTYGFEQFRRMVEGFPPETASRICDVPVGTIRSLAHLYGKTKPATILMGYGVQHYYNGGHTIRAIDALAALTGNIGIPGGGANYGSSTMADWICPVDGRELRRPNPASGQDPVRPRLFPRPVMAKRILEANSASSTEPPVRAMVISRANPVNQVPNSRRTIEAMTTVPFKVTIDIRMSETALLSDLVLPATSWLEECDIMLCSWHNYITFTEQAIEPRGEAMHEKDIFALVSERLGIDAGLDKSLEYWADVALRPLNRFGITAAALKGRSVRLPVAPIVAWEDGKFRTPSGRFEFYSLRAESEGIDPLPRWVEPFECATDDQEYPFIAVNARRIGHMHSQFAETLLRDGRVPVLISRKAAAEVGVEEGDGVEVIARPRDRSVCPGRVKGIVIPVDEMREDVVVGYEGPSVLSDQGPNLISPDILTDFGLSAAYCDCRVRIEKRD